MKYFLAILAFVFSFIGQAQDTLQVLMIGNSYTYYNDMPQTLEKMCWGAGKAVKITSITTGGHSLEDHTKDSNTVQKLRLPMWDLIILQEHSLGAAIPTYTNDVSIPNILKLKAQMPICSKVLYQTWGREKGGKHCIKEPTCTRNFANYQDMQDLIDSNYWNMEEKCQMPLVPIGLAWKEVIHHRADINLFDPDGSHPSAYGSYLTACVFYSAFFGKITEQTYVPKGLSPHQTKYLAHTAFWIYQKERERCGLKVLLD